MRLNNVLEELLGSKPKIKILRALLKVNVPLTGRKVALLSGLNHRTCLLSLRELSREGFISIRSAGKAKLYTLNLENTYLKNSISKIFRDEKRLISNLFKSIKIKLKGKIYALILFGSIVEGKEQPDSDIDICIVIKSLLEKRKIEKIIENETDRIMKEYGNDLSCYYITKNNFIKKYKRKDKLISEIAKRGRIIGGERFF